MAEFFLYTCGRISCDFKTNDEAEAMKHQNDLRHPIETNPVPEKPEK